MLEYKVELAILHCQDCTPRFTKYTAGCRCTVALPWTARTSLFQALFHVLGSARSSTIVIVIVDDQNLVGMR